MLDPLGVWHVAVILDMCTTCDFEISMLAVLINAAGAHFKFGFWMETKKCGGNLINLYPVVRLN